MSLKSYPVLPLRDAVVFPHIVMPVFVGRAKSIAAIEAGALMDQWILVVPQHDPNVADPKFDDVSEYGVLCRVLQYNKQAEDSAKALLEGVERVKIKVWSDENSLYSQAQVVKVKETLKVSDEAEFAEMRKLALEQFGQWLRENDKNAMDLLEALWNEPNVVRIIDTIATHMDMENRHRMGFLSILNVEKRLRHLLMVLSHELERTRLRGKIQKRVKKQMDKAQHEYFLNEQMKAILRELHGDDEQQNEMEQLESKIRAAGMSAEVEKKALSELSKLKQMQAMSSEATVVRSYLDWLISYPWSKQQEVRIDLAQAAQILDEDHYGLEEIKDRILDYLAVQKRNQGSKAPIICLVGPPGVGKTSLGKSIARSTGRDFERIALGGVHDEAEIRGHRRTYIGALPGKIVQKLCKLGSRNPVILLDEIDKIGHDHRGDPAAALLEVLDPAQNHQFNDHYFEVDVDLSNVLFIATANTLDIPAPLRDRMEIIHVSGYTAREKAEIAKRYIWSKQMREHGLRDDELSLEEGVIEHVIEHYTREAGVRQLERELGKLARKAVRHLESRPSASTKKGAKKSASQASKALCIKRADMVEYLGVAKYVRDEHDHQSKIGCITGLAWTSVGGELLSIETTTFSGTGKLTHTGQLGDVMKESIQTALSVVRHYLSVRDPDFSFQQYDIHMHLPEGATPKDGPSAGIAMASVLLSALKQLPVRGDVAMTGEITLRGRVLAIGGLKEKLLAAVRGGIRKVLIPADNVKDLRDIPEEVKSALEIVSVSHVEEVFAHVLEHNPLAVSEQKAEMGKKVAPVSARKRKKIEKR
ncbi:MAG: endopeptidase La [Cardiobacteriaceae bacterium]|nr:endopeptidase La [Cardiobacteriaceae bacterium]